MPASSRTPWLICYDIADRRRLRDVHREVRRYATPFQRSVYRIYASRRDVARLLRRLERVIDPGRDDVRAYPLLTNSPAVVYGAPLLAAGLWVEPAVDAAL